LDFYIITNDTVLIRSKLLSHFCVLLEKLVQNWHSNHFLKYCYSLILNINQMKTASYYLILSLLKNNLFTIGRTWSFRTDVWILRRCESSLTDRHPDSEQLQPQLEKEVTFFVDSSILRTFFFTNNAHSNIKLIFRVVVIFQVL
jgi:hypothetical protein